MKNANDHENFLDFMQSSSVLTQIGTDPTIKQQDTQSFGIVDSFKQAVI